jgi:CRP-like cAMP-binding protein
VTRRQDDACSKLEEHVILDLGVVRAQQCLLQTLTSLSDLTDEECEAVLRLPLALRRYDAGQDIFHEGDCLDGCYLMLEGFVQAYKQMPDGRCQIQAFHIPGDMQALQSLYLQVLDHSLGAMMPTLMAFVRHKDVRGLIDRHPGLRAAFAGCMMADMAIARQWIIGLGRREARERVAHLVCELFWRFDAAGRTQGFTFRLPLTQTEFGYALGLSTPQAHRVLRNLQQAGLVTWARSNFTILDWDRLQMLARFDPVYLSVTSASHSSLRSESTGTSAALAAA